jgi:hypothetical protein
MPFPNQTPRAFTRANIEAIAPGQVGCYGLFNVAGWIYVGRGDIRQRLLAHLEGDNTLIILRGPTHWVDVVTANHVEMEKALIVECQPACNRKVG